MFRVEALRLNKGPPFNPQGGGGGIFEIKKFGQNLQEINNLLQKLFYINM